MAKSETRFDGVTGGEEYELFLLAAPYVDELEAIAARKVADHFADSSAKQINVFEIGVGTGITTAHLLEADPRFHIFGVDFEPKMIEAARSYFDFLMTITKPNVKLIVGDALEKLREQPAQSFEAVVSGYCLHNIYPQQRAEIMAEIARVLRPGGIFMNLDKYAEDDAVAHFLALAEQLTGFEVYLGEKVNRPDVYLEWFNHYLEDDQIQFTMSEQIQSLAHLGFTAPVFTDRTAMDAIMVATKL